MLDPKLLATLIIVVSKAKNLPNKSRFGKQDPYCAITYNGETQRSKPIKRGGQHPVWDEEMRFKILEDVDDILAKTKDPPATLKGKDASLPPLPAGEGIITPQQLAQNARKGKKGGKAITIACYADDPKQPELIGECIVPIDTLFSNGEVDEWYELIHKERYAGEVYLEMTMWLNGPPPVTRPPKTQAAAGAATAGTPPRPAVSHSVSGGKLYEPPYRPPTRPGTQPPAQPVRPPGPGGIPHSVSGGFAELGLPPGHQPGTTVAGQPGYPPGRHGHHHSIDQVTGQMLAMSVGPGVAAAHGPPAHGVAVAPGHHRHSFNGVAPPAGAPWAALIPPSHQTVPTHQRPMTADVTAVHRPLSTAGIPLPVAPQSVPPIGHHRTGSMNHYQPLVPPPVPSQQLAQPPALSHSQSYTHLPRPASTEPPRTASPQSYYHPPQPQQPPPPSHYVPALPPPKSQYQHPGHPQPAASPQNYPPVPPPPVQFQASTTPAPHGYQPSPTPAPHGYPLSTTPAPHVYQSPPTPVPPPQGYTPVTSPPLPQSYAPQHATSPPPHAAHSPPPAGSTSTGTYVPWYMQTPQQHPQVHPGHVPPMHPQSPGQLPPPVPPPPQQYTHTASAQQHAPNPPPPPRPPTSVGYYPSDEIYAIKASHSPQQTHVSPPVHHQQPPPAAPQWQSGGYRPTSPALPPKSTSPRPMQLNEAPWAHLQQTNQPPAQSSTAYYASQPADFRPTTAAPEGWTNTLAGGSGGGAPVRYPSPFPPTSPPPPGAPAGGNRDWRSYMRSLSQSEHSTSGQNPLPPIPDHGPGQYAPAQGSGDWYSPPPPAVPASIQQQGPYH